MLRGNHPPSHSADEEMSRRFRVSRSGLGGNRL